MDTQADRGYGELMSDGRLRCLLCPRACLLANGGCGVCGVRRSAGGRIRSTVFGRPSGMAVDPIEKKPLHHFLPGSGVLSFGTIGCNLTCDFCQNHHISRERDETTLPEDVIPETIAAEAQRLGCAGVAFTYNEPVVWLEYAVATAIACHQRDLVTVAVSAGYISGQAREDFFAPMDAANIDLKGFSEGFYRRHCGAGLAPVLDTLRWLRHHTRVWLEVTTLIIPGENNADDELRAEFRWLADELGRDVPLHLSAFRPDHRLVDVPATPVAAMKRARDLALDAGLHFVYCGNLRERVGSDTLCPGCGATVIGRDGWNLDAWRLHAGTCESCGTVIPGRFADQPGGWSGSPRGIRSTLRRR